MPTPRARRRYSLTGLPLLLLACAGPWDDGNGRDPGSRRAPPAPAVPGSPGGEQPAGNVRGAGSPSAPAGTSAMAATGMPAATGCSPHDPGPWVLRRLTNDEYENTVRDLTGYPRPVAGDLVDDEPWGRRLALPPLAPIGAEQYSRAAAAIGAHLLAGAGLQALAGCAAGEACGRKLIAEFAPRAYRRPLQAEEVAILEEAYREGASDGDGEGLRALLLAILQAPQLLYRLEPGQPRRDGESFVRLTAWETAARLSYHFWGTLPDTELALAAGTGQLDSPDQIARQAQRLLADPRAHARVARLHRRWLDLGRLDVLEKDAADFPAFTAALRADLRGEMDRYLDVAFWDPGSDLEKLLTSPQTFLSPALAAHYGLPPPAGTGLQPVALDSTRYGGLITRGPMMAMLASAWETSVVQRGVFVLQNLLCADLPPPPPDITIDPPAPLPPTATMRERLEQHASNPACASCHAQIDPIGFALETFDAVGRWRASDQGRPIDTSGRLSFLPDRPHFKDAVELSRVLAASPRTSECMVRTWFELSFGRRPDEKADACSLQVMQQRFTSGGQHLRDLFVTATETDAFRFRRPSPGGQP